MEEIKAIVLGIVHGSTEWVPVSSIAHLRLFERILDTQINPAFLALLHLAALTSILLFYRKEVRSYLISAESTGFRTSKNGMLAVLASLPLIVAGYLLAPWIDLTLSSFFFVGVFLIINSAMLFATKFASGQDEVSISSAFASGIVQLFSILPGISRFGAALSSNMLTGIRDEVALMFSMMMSIPTLLGMAIYEFFLSSVPSSSIAIGIFSLILGYFSASITGYYAIGYVVSMIQRKRINHLWFYCLLLGIVMLFN